MKDIYRILYKYIKIEDLKNYEILKIEHDNDINSKYCKFRKQKDINNPFEISTIDIYLEHKIKLKFHNELIEFGINFDEKIILYRIKKG